MIYTRRRLLLLAAGAAVVALAAGSLIKNQAAARGSKAVNTLDSPSGAAIKGYDPVAYFVSGKPMRGLEEHAVTHAGARWLFSNAENKALFERDPAKYIPAYGGYCAYGVAQGYLVKIEPDSWAIRNGKLYLNYDKGVQKQWSAAPDQFIAEAEKKWPRLVAPQ